MTPEQYVTTFLTQQPGEAEEAFAARKAALITSIRSHADALANWAIVEADDVAPEDPETSDLAR